MLAALAESVAAHVAGLEGEAQDHAALLVHGRLPPAWLALRPWYRERALTRMVNTNGNGRAYGAATPTRAAEELG